MIMPAPPSGAIYRQTISVNLKFTTTYLIDGLLGLSKLDVLGHRLVCWCHVKRGLRMGGPKKVGALLRRIGVERTGQVH